MVLLACQLMKHQRETIKPELLKRPNLIMTVIAYQLMKHQRETQKLELLKIPDRPSL